MVGVVPRPQVDDIDTRKKQRSRNRSARLVSSPLGDVVGKDAELMAEYAKPEVVKLLQLLQEATRATPTSGPDTYVPPMNGEVAEADYHHFIFGQRGSGKSSLL